DGKRARHPVGAERDAQASQGRSEEVDAEEGSEGEGVRLERNVQQAEPHHLQRQRAEPAEGVEEDPGAELSRVRGGARAGGAGRSTARWTKAARHSGVYSHDARAKRTS